MPRNGKGVTKAIIEQAAISLFSKKGYKNTSMNEVAARSNLTKRTVYKYFPSKLNLLFSIFEYYLKELHDEQTILVNKELPIDIFIRESIKSIFQFSMKNLSFMKLFWALDLNEFEGELSDDLKEHIRLWNSGIANQAADYINKKCLTGRLVKYTAEEVVEMISATNKGMVLQLSKDENFSIGTIQRDRILDAFLTFFELALQSNES